MHKQPKMNHKIIRQSFIVENKILFWFNAIILLVCDVNMEDYNTTQIVISRMKSLNI